MKTRPVLNWFWIVFILVGGAGQASAFTIRITDEGLELPENFSVVVSRYIGSETLVLDTIKVHELPFETTVSVADKTPGLFYLQVKGESNRAEFIWSNTDDRMTIESSYWALRNGVLQIENSAENSAYGQLLNAKLEADQRIEYLEMKLKEISAFDKDYKRMMTNYEDSIESTIMSFNGALLKISLQFESTYVNQCLVGLSKLPSRKANPQWAQEFDGYLAVMNQYYFENCRFDHPQILNHYALEDKVITYLDRYTLKTTDGAIQGIDVIMSAASDHPEVQSYLYSLLLKNFLQFKTETLARYLLDNYADGCSLDLSIEEHKRLAQMKSIMVGSTIPNIQLEDVGGKLKDLKDHYRKNDVTVVYIWISWCVKCKEQSPRIKNLFNRFRKKGLGVFSISLDEKRDDWELGLENHDQRYPNVCELTSVESSSVAPRLGISTTPKVFLVNSQGVILEKDIYGDRLETWIEDHFQ